MHARCVAVAFSGGRDSTALLHATLQAAQTLGIEVAALHVHHGLHADADAWLAYCRTVCARWARSSAAPLRFASAHLSGRPPAGQSVEAWARDERYRALAAMARQQQATLVLLAQHRRDQAETLLLQALRGGGVAGLAAMPAQTRRDGIVWARPWLGQPRETIEAYLRRHRLRFIDDGSNADPRFARNRLRAEVWPALLRAFEHAETTLSSAAARSAQASELLAEVAAEDLARMADDGGLDVAAWRRSSVARRRNALLEWLRRGGVVAATLVERLMDELPGASNARWPASAAAQLRLYRGRLSIEAAADARPAPAPETRLCITRPGSYALPGWRGRFIVRRVQGGGVVPALLARLRVVAREGGERFQFAPRSAPRALKKQFQALGVAAWQRDGPLLFAVDRLVYVPGLGIDARVRAGDGDEQFGLRWQLDAGR